MTSIDTTLDSLKAYNYLGEKRLEDGTLLIAKAPHIAPSAWLHSIYPPLSEDQIVELELQLQTRIPETYRAFLKKTNGLKVFNTTLSLDGFRKNYHRTVNDVWQPFNILTPNTLERPLNSADSLFYIGGYDWDGSLLYIDSATGLVHVCDGEDASPRYSWNNFEQMLESEVKRLAKLFDKAGKQLDPDETTLPI